MGGFGAASGYLIAVFVTATGAEGETLGPIKQTVAGALSGVVGTKLLTLWDDLTKGDAPKIFSPAIYLQVVALLVGFTLSLAAFYTVRNLEAVTVNITAEPDKLVSYQSANGQAQNGIPLLPSEKTQVQFTGAAASSKDMSVLWKVEPNEPSSEIQNALEKDGAKDDKQSVKKDKDLVNIDSSSGLLTVMPKVDLNKADKDFDFPPNHRFPIDWIVVATSRQNKDQSKQFPIRLCVVDTDCPPVKAAVKPSEK